MYFLDTGILNTALRMLSVIIRSTHFFAKCLHEDCPSFFRAFTHWLEVRLYFLKYAVVFRTVLEKLRRQNSESSYASYN